MECQLKYKAGDRVKVREDLEEKKTYFMEDCMENGFGRYLVKSNSAVHSMMQLKGKVVTIESITFFGQYIIYGSNYNWTDGMFEGKVNKVFNGLEE